MITDNVAAVLLRFEQAMSARDADALAACFAADYCSEQPAHPARAFRGRAEVRTHWAGIFRAIPDLRADTVRETIDGATAWAEFRWFGHKRDGSVFEVCGMRVFGIRDGEIAWGRLYIEPVERNGEGQAAVLELVTR